MYICIFISGQHMCSMYTHKDIYIHKYIFHIQSIPYNCVGVIYICSIDRNGTATRSVTNRFGHFQGLLDGDTAAFEARMRQLHHATKKSRILGDHEVIMEIF